MTRNPACASLLATVVSLGRCLEIKIAAKGVSSKQQLQSLSASGIDFLQGPIFVAAKSSCRFFDSLPGAKLDPRVDAERFAS